MARRMSSRSGVLTSTTSPSRTRIVQAAMTCPLTRTEQTRQVPMLGWFGSEQMVGM